MEEPDESKLFNFQTSYSELEKLEELPTHLNRDKTWKFQNLNVQSLPDKFGRLKSWLADCKISILSIYLSTLCPFMGDILNKTKFNETVSQNIRLLTDS